MEVSDGPGVYLWVDGLSENKYYKVTSTKYSDKELYEFARNFELYGKTQPSFWDRVKKALSFTSN